MKQWQSSGIATVTEVPSDKVRPFMGKNMLQNTTNTELVVSCTHGRSTLIITFIYIE